MLSKCFLFLVACVGVWTKRLANWKYLQANGLLVTLSVAQLLLGSLSNHDSDDDDYDNIKKLIF